ncbi:MAG: type I restriction enzyme HsdR N-terminal domain-containing protein [Aeriscardovia sp.]|nr:type I restriction enzyme HsdR N-terminal domain-containing protein [Aeriscardovia sp.]
MTLECKIWDMEQIQFAELKRRLKVLKDNLTSEYGPSSDGISIRPPEWQESQLEAYIIEPFTQALGFKPGDPKSPETVLPQPYRGVRSPNTRADFGLYLNSQLVIVIECKRLNESLDKDVSQLDEYFRPQTGQINTVKVGILTNGDEFRFYTDYENHNVMDCEPYWKFRLSELSDKDVRTLLLYATGNLEETLRDLPAIVYAEKLKRWLLEGGKENLEWLYKATSKEIKADSHNKKLYAEKVWDFIFPTSNAAEGSLDMFKANVADLHSAEEKHSIEGKKINLSNLSSPYPKISGYEIEDIGFERVNNWAEALVSIIRTLCEKYDLPDRMQKNLGWFRQVAINNPSKPNQTWVKVTNEYEVNTHSSTEDKISELKKCFKAIGINMNRVHFYSR